MKILIPTVGTRTAALALLLLAAFGPRTAEAVDSPGTNGPWAVGHRVLPSVDASRGNRSLPLDVWYPADAVGATAPFSYYPLSGPLALASVLAHEGVPVSEAGVRPLVVFSHGSGGIATQSVHLTEHLASHGFIVVAPSHTGNTTADVTAGTAVPIAQALLDRVPDVSFVIDHMLALSATPGDPFFGRIDGQRVGVVGHSLGGFTALAVASGYQGIPADARVRAIMPIAPAAAALTDAELSGIAVPTLFMTGTNDGLLADEIRAAGLIDTDPFNYRADVIGAAHTHFANICDIANVLISLGFLPPSWPGLGAGALIGPYNETCIPPAFPIEEATRILNVYATAFLRRHLLAERFYDEYLGENYAEASEPDVEFARSTSQCTPGECGLCETCDPGIGCISRPATGCRRPTAARAATLVIRDVGDAQQDRIVWRWKKGALTSVGDFGDPTTTTNYALCVYENADSTPKLAMRNHLPIGQCDGKPCWRTKSPTQLDYQSRSSTGAGVRHAMLRAGGEGQAAIAVRGRGENLHVPVLPLSPKLTVQLQAEGGQCWEAEYSGASTRAVTGGKKLSALSD